jgi:hypothetical protein
MTRSARIANRLRWWLLIVGLAFELAAIGWILALYLFWIFKWEGGGAGLVGTPFLAPGVDDEPAYLINALVVVGLLILAQWVFLRPGRLLPIRLTSHGRPLKSAVIVAAAMAMLLTLGAFALLLELSGVWKRNPSLVDRGQPWMSVGGIWAGMLAVWAIWTALFYRYWRDGDRYTQLGRIVRALIAGSFVEAVVSAPVQAFASKEDDCYCERGSYTTLICAGAVLFWAFGPGIALLFLREHYRRARLFPHCQACGYDLRGGLRVCPECGTSVSAPDHETSQHDDNCD